MNFESDNVYIAIKNNRELLERVFRGMFIVARRVLGYSTPGSSYPFATSNHWSGRQSFQKDAAFLQSKGAVMLCENDYPHKNHGRSDNTQYFKFVTMTECNETNPNGIIFQALRDAGDIDRDAVNTNHVAQALFDEHFNDMVAYARASRTYTSAW
tara:strand:- start:1835 stop:2299 length:465 start_codon:yes stop_codon:yes gene_type:complete